MGMGTLPKINATPKISEHLSKYGFFENKNGYRQLLQESVELAAAATNCPAAYISLIDEKNQYVIAQSGILLGTCSRDESICQFSVAKDGLNIIEDVRKDERTKNLSIVKDQKIVFYAGHTLTNSDNYTIGAICVIDHEYRTLTASQKSTLKILSQHIIQLLDQRKYLLQQIKLLNSNFVTDHCRDLDGLRSEMNHLQQQVLKQNRLVHEQYESLEVKNEALTYFARMVSHDIREPLRTIAGFSKLLNKEIKSKGIELSEDYLEYIQTASDKLSQLTSQVLERTIERKGIVDTNEKTALCDVLADVKLNLDKLIQDKEAILMFPSQKFMLRGNHVMFVQLFQNFISNSIKYHREGVKPKVKISVFNKGQKCGVVIEDNGIGIPNEKLNSIFNPYERAHTDGSYEGFGIGLNTCKRIMQQLDCNYSIKSEVEKGTSIFLDIPMPIS